MRKQIAAANWKMNLTLEKAEILMNEIAESGLKLSDNREAVFAVPFPYLLAMKPIADQQSGFFIAAQNIADEKNGAFTGEVSGEMLASIGIPYVLIGHSERREYYGETAAILVKKINLALAENLKPIFCCGEPLQIRESGNQNAHISKQLSEALYHLNAEQMFGFVIAYEPIWAIGTGLTASAAQAQEMHAHIRAMIGIRFGTAVADSVSLLYGGSVKGANAGELFSQPDIDGGLVGGASLVSSEFVQIIRSLKI